MEVARGAFQEVLGQRGDLLAALAERRDGEADDGEAVVEVFAEASLGDEALEVGVGRGDHAHVDADGPRVAEGLDLARLEESQQLRLDVEAQLADLVEEEGASGGGADDAGEVGGGAGEGPAAVAEELAVDHLARDGRAVERHEGVGAAAGGGVDHAGDHLLAGAGLAGEQDQDVERRNPLDVRHQLRHGLAEEDRAVRVAAGLDGPQGRSLALVAARLVLEAGAACELLRRQHHQGGVHAVGLAERDLEAAAVPVAEVDPAGRGAGEGTGLPPGTPPPRVDVRSGIARAAGEGAGEGGAGVEEQAGDLVGEYLRVPAGVDDRGGPQGGVPCGRGRGGDEPGDGVEADGDARGGRRQLVAAAALGEGERVRSNGRPDCLGVLLEEVDAGGAVADGGEDAGGAFEGGAGAREVAAGRERDGGDAVHLGERVHRGGPGLGRGLGDDGDGAISSPRADERLGLKEAKGGTEG